VGNPGSALCPVWGPALVATVPPSDVGLVSVEDVVVV